MQKEAEARSRGTRQEQGMVMKIYGFSFKREAMWIMAFPFASLLIGLLVALVLWFVRS